MIIVNELFLLSAKNGIEATGITADKKKIFLLFTKGTLQIIFDDGKCLLHSIPEFKNNEWITLRQLKYSVSSWLWIPDQYNTSKYGTRINF
jgi:hypothetical protein